MNRDQQSYLRIYQCLKKEHSRTRNYEALSKDLSSFLPSSEDKDKKPQPPFFPQQLQRKQMEIEKFPSVYKNRLPPPPHLSLQNQIQHKSISYENSKPQEKKKWTDEQLDKLIKSYQDVIKAYVPEN